MKTLTYIILVFLFCADTYAQIASSKDTVYRIDEINVISSRVETNIYWSPTSVRVIDEKQISNSNGDRLTDILKSSGNIFLKSYGSNVSLNTISFNGLGAEHTLILINGKKLNSFQNSQVDLSLIPKDKIEKIEIMNNGASSIYGSNAIGGVVNVITKNGLNEKTNARVSGSIGSYGYSKYAFNFMNSQGKVNYDLFYSKEKSKDNFKYYFDDGISKKEKERLKNEYDADNLFLNIDYKVNKKNELRINSGYFAQTRNVPGMETGTPPASSEQKDLNWNNNLSYKYIINDNMSLSSDVNYQNNLMKYKEPGLSESFYKNRIISNNSVISFKDKYFKNTSGFEITYADLNGSNYDYTVSRKQYSLFSAGEINISDKLKMFPSARYDYISDMRKNVVTGKFGINYRPFDKINLNIRTSVGNNFSAPTFNELYWQNIGNPDLKPEKSINYDAGVIYRFNLISENTIEVNYTRIKLDDKIVWKPAEYGFWRPFNLDKSESNIFSIDFKTKKKILKNLVLSFNYNYTYNKSTKESIDYPGDQSYGKQIFYIPIELSKMNFEAEYNNLSLNIFYSFTGRRYSDFENMNRLPVIDLVDGNIGYTFSVSKFKLNTRFEVNNIFNEDYRIMQGYPMPLRNFKVNISLIY